MGKSFKLYLAFVVLITSNLFAQNDSIRLQASLVKDTVNEYERIWVKLEIHNDSESHVYVFDELTNPRPRLNRIASVQDSLEREVPYKEWRNVRCGSDAGLHVKRNSMESSTLYLIGYGDTTYLGQYLPPGRYNIRTVLRYRIGNENYNGPPLQMFDNVQVVVRAIDKVERDKYLKVSEYCTKLEDQCNGPVVRTKKQREEYDRYGSERRQRDCDSLRRLQIAALRSYLTSTLPSDIDYDITSVIVPRAYSLKEYEIIVRHFIELYERHKVSKYVYSQLFFYQIPFSQSMVEKYSPFMKRYIKERAGKDDKNAEYFKSSLAWRNE